MKRALVIAIWVVTAATFYLLFAAGREHGKSDWEVFRALVISPFGLTLAVVLVIRRMRGYFYQVEPPSLENGEGPIHAGWVYHPVSWDPVLGALYLTTRRIHFRPCRINFHKVKITIALNQITDVCVYRRRFQYRLAITDDAGHRTEFIINRITRSLAKKINLAREAARN